MMNDLLTIKSQNHSVQFLPLQTHHKPSFLSRKFFWSDLSIDSMTLAVEASRIFHAPISNAIRNGIEVYQTNLSGECLFVNFSFAVHINHRCHLWAERQTAAVMAPEIKIIVQDRMFHFVLLVKSIRSSLLWVELDVFGFHKLSGFKYKELIFTLFQNVGALGILLIHLKQSFLSC